jgi:hypothetical protein
MLKLAMAVLGVVVAAAGCSKKDDASTNAKPAETKADKGGEAKPAGGAQKLPKLGLSINVDGDVTFGDAIMGEGDLVQGASVGALQIETWKSPQTIDQAKDDAQSYTPKNLKADKLADGWVLTYDNTGSMGANYFVTVRRDLGGKTYKCSTTGSEAAQASAAVAACKSLK